MTEELASHAARTIQAGSKSFAVASRLFSPATRRSAVMLYAWCRYCDDVIDGQELGFGQSPGQPGAGHAQLAELQRTTRLAYSGERMSNPAFAAFQEVALRHGIPEHLPMEHLAGYSMDVHERQYHTLDDTLEYCYHVAGVVGVMMAMIMGVRDESTLDRACDLGLAFQLTNIARDLVEDAGVGRCYMPAVWLREAGLERAELAEPAQREALAGLAARLVEIAEPYYQSALGGLSALPPRSAWAIATAHGVYREIGIRVKAMGAQAWDGRVSTSTGAKLRIMLAGGGRVVSSRGRTPEPRPAGLWQRAHRRVEAGGRHEQSAIGV